jgi:hypothetical protein
MRTISILAVLLLLPGCASMTASEKWYIGVVGADLATTAIGLNQGLTEQNPIFAGKTDGETIARAFVLNAAFYWLMHKWIDKHTTFMQKKYWNILIGVRSPVVLWNGYQIVDGTD